MLKLTMIELTTREGSQMRVWRDRAVTNRFQQSWYLDYAEQWSQPESLPEGIIPIELARLLLDRPGFEYTADGHAELTAVRLATILASL